MALGNGTWSSYAYEPLTRRLAHLETRTPSGRILQNIGYGYDRVGNVLTTVNAIGEPVGDRSGTVAFQYRYDDLYRLTWATGEAKARAHTIDRFTAQYAYSDIHNMTSNVQIHEIVHGDGAGVSAERPPKTNHEFAYTYANPAPHQATRIGETLLVYDDNGNTVKECRDHGSFTCDVTPDHLRTYEWTEENRLHKVVDGGGKNLTRFVYDAGGDRLVKLGRGGESITVGQFWSLKGRRTATKHVFAGSTRLASKLLPPPGWTSQTPTLQVPPTPADGNPVGDGLPNDTGCEASSYNPQKCPVLAGGTPVVNHFFDDTTVRPETYYYHPDHLGSTSWVTDQNGRVHEHVEYFPYGEVWRDPRSDSDGGPQKGQRFLFTGKELDEETGLVYFGARYYDPGRARWLNADPALALYLPERPGAVAQLPAGGVFASVNLSPYHYALLNPIRFLDSTGLWGKEHWSGTLSAAREVGGIYPQVAKRIAFGNSMVDKHPATDFMPTGDPGFHFNIPEGGESSLDRRFAQYYALAASSAVAALEHGRRAFAACDPGTSCQPDMEELRNAHHDAAMAFMELGSSMHPIGDKDAHSDYQDTFLGIYYHDQEAWPISLLGDGINRADDRFYRQERYENTLKNWREILEGFRNGLGAERFNELQELYRLGAPVDGDGSH